MVSFALAVNSRFSLNDEFTTSALRFNSRTEYTPSNPRLGIPTRSSPLRMFTSSDVASFIDRSTSSTSRVLVER